MYDAKNIPCHDVKMGQRPRDPGPPPSLKMRPGTSLKFKSGIPGPPSKFKSGRNIYIWNIYIRHFYEIVSVTLGVPNALEVSIFSSRGRDPCNLFGVQLARQFMKLISFICLTYHLSDNLKIRHKFSPTIYTNLY